MYVNVVHFIHTPAEAVKYSDFIFEALSSVFIFYEYIKFWCDVTY